MGTFRNVQTFRNEKNLLGTNINYLSRLGTRLFMDKKNDSNKRKVDLNAENAMYKQETNCNSITNKIECTINTKLEGGKGHFSQNSEFFLRHKKCHRRLRQR